MFCTKCGMTVNDGDQFCGKCGNALTLSQEADTRSPNSTVKRISSSQDAIGQNTSWTQLLFSFRGRLDRSRYWRYLVAPFIGISIGLTLIDIAMDTFDDEVGIGVLGGAFAVFALWPSVAAMTKRLHDRNKSAWWWLVILIPIVNLWPLLEIGFVKGTNGDNRFGPDPVKNIP